MCEETLPRTPYSARTVDVGPLTTHLATEMVKEAQPGVSDVSAATADLLMAGIAGRYTARSFSALSQPQSPIYKPNGQQSS